MNMESKKPNHEQKEITKPAPLLNAETGQLPRENCGYSKTMLLEYNRAHIKANAMRIKEWDYYLVMNDKFAVTFTVADNSYLGLVGSSLLEFTPFDDDGKGDEKNTKDGKASAFVPTQHNVAVLSAFPNGKTNMPSSTLVGDTKVTIGRGQYSVTLLPSSNDDKNAAMKNEGQNNGENNSNGNDASSTYSVSSPFVQKPTPDRRLEATLKNFKDGRDLVIDITLSDAPRESLTIATPYKEDPYAFYYNQKINCMVAKGTATLKAKKAKNGNENVQPSSSEEKEGQEEKDKVYRFNGEEDNSFGLLDWGRGVWRYSGTWYWSSASGRLPNGKRLGFNLGYGFGDTGAATENMIIYDGKAHKLQHVDFGIPMKKVRGGLLAGYRTYETEDYVPSTPAATTAADDAKKEDGIKEGKEEGLSSEAKTQPWHFTSSDKRFECTFTPIIDRRDYTNVLIIRNEAHQVFGKFTGRLVLDDGEVIDIKDFMGFAEKVMTRW